MEKVGETLRTMELPFNLTPTDKNAKAEYCPTCGEKTTGIRMSNGQTFSYKCICRCEQAKLQAEEEKQRQIEKRLYLEKLKDLSLISQRYRDITFKSTCTGNNPSFDNLYERCKKYCEVANLALKNGYGMYIYGDKGTGKSHITSAMANELMAKGYSVLFTNFFEIARAIKSTMQKGAENIDYISRIIEVDFLFIDDIGTERMAKQGEDTWLQEQEYVIINKRYNAKKPTIFSSNFSIRELISQRGLADRTADRIFEMSNAILHVTGRSYRQANRKTDLPF